VAGEVLGSVATGRRKPKRSQASDLLGEETAGKSVRWRRERVEMGVFCPRWQRRSPPQLAGEARRRRRRSCVASELEGESERAWLGRLTDPDPSRVGLTEPGGPVGPVGPIGPNGPRPFV
jgi:hypothetical protein